MKKKNAKKLVCALVTCSLAAIGMCVPCTVNKAAVCSPLTYVAAKSSDNQPGTYVDRLGVDPGLSLAQDTIIEAGKEYSFITNNQCESSVCYESTGDGYFYFEFCPQNAYGTTLSGEEESVTKPQTFFTDFYVVGEGITDTFDKDKIYNYTSYKTSSISLPKGKKATFKVSGYDSLFMSNVSISYTIKVVQVNPKRFETEDNESKKDADKIKVGKYYSGLISNVGDIDYYVFKAPKTKKYKIKVGLTDNKYEYGKVSFKAYKGSKLLKDKSVSLNDKTVTLYSGKLKKGQKIYIKCNLGFGENVTYTGNSFYRIKIQ